MTALVWDEVGERIYRTGIDRGVLYTDSASVVWNGLTSVEETPNGEVKPFYLNGVKYLEYLAPGDFSASLKAYTYPDEFDEVNGLLKPISGLHIYDQPAKNFGLTYRTKIGNDLVGIDFAYELHFLYNILASPDAIEFPTLAAETTAIEFSWTLSARPVTDSSFTWRPTAHVSIDSREVTEEVLQSVEDIIYGTESGDPRLPTIGELYTALS